MIVAVIARALGQPRDLDAGLAQRNDVVAAEAGGRFGGAQQPGGRRQQTGARHMKFSGIDDE